MIASWVFSKIYHLDGSFYSTLSFKYRTDFLTCVLGIPFINDILGNTDLTTGTFRNFKKCYKCGVYWFTVEWNAVEEAWLNYKTEEKYR